MKFGDVILFKPTSFIGKAIAFVDGSAYSHAAVYLGEYDGVDLFIESHEKKSGVVITKLERWRNYTVLRSNLKHKTKKELMQKLGTGYDFSMIRWILIAKLFNKDAQANDEGLLICSELVDWFFEYQIGEGKICTPKTIALSNKFTIIKS
jgi:hypothetical protein